MSFIFSDIYLVLVTFEEVEEVGAGERHTPPAPSYTHLS